MGVELGFSVTREEGGRGPGQGNQSREEGPGPEGPASREGRGFSSVGGAAEGLEQRVAAPGSAFLLRSLSSTRVLDMMGLRGPGSQAGLRRATGRPLQACLSSWNLHRVGGAGAGDLHLPSDGHSNLMVS